MRVVPIASFAASVAAVAVLAGCGSASDEPTTPPPPPEPAARVEDFPKAKGKTLETLRAGLPKGPTLAPTTGASLTGGRQPPG